MIGTNNFYNLWRLYPVDFLLWFLPSSGAFAEELIQGHTEFPLLLVENLGRLYRQCDVFNTSGHARPSYLNHPANAANASLDSGLSTTAEVVNFPFFSLYIPF